jgi:hypothetical protein
MPASMEPAMRSASCCLPANTYAASPYLVSFTETSRDYSDPIEFFNRTYLTEGLRNLIGGAMDRLRGDPNASPVVNLQTNFGGGKTHSMLALWHLASGRPISDFPQDVQDLLNAHRYQDIPADVKRVAIVGNHFAASGENRGDVRVNTVWGELAWQLGGKEGYELVRQADETSTAPGEALHELLEYFAPAVILIDEWVAYARQLVGREDLAGGTFETKFTFAQALTEAVKAIPGMFLAISIPASHDSDRADADAIGSGEEVGGENGALAPLRDPLPLVGHVPRGVGEDFVASFVDKVADPGTVSAHSRCAASDEHGDPRPLDRRRHRTFDHAGIYSPQRGRGQC